MVKTIITGKSASGKDYLRNKMVQKGYKYCIPYTTRPIRENEKNGIDYHFIDENTFKTMIDTNSFYYFESFNEWFYGITYNSWILHDLFIMTPSAIKKLKEEDLNKSFIIYLDTPVKIRKKRLKNRKMPGDSIERRIAADEKDFELFASFDIKCK